MNSLQKIGGEFVQRSNEEMEHEAALFEIAQMLLPRFGVQWNAHSMVTQKRQTLSRLIYYYELYLKILSVPGVVCEFGVQWGATLNTLMNLRGMLEPYNHSRKVYGFDTFEGFSSVDTKEGGHSKVGDFGTMNEYQKVLHDILSHQEFFSPIAHIKKFELVKGDASTTFPKWLEANPHAIVSMAIFDMDVYKPTKDVLQLVIPRLTKGSLLVFDELNCAHFPGETAAVSEVLGLNNMSLRRSPHQTYCAWAVFGE